MGDKTPHLICSPATMCVYTQVSYFINPRRLWPLLSYYN